MIFLMSLVSISKFCVYQYCFMDYVELIGFLVCLGFLKSLIQELYIILIHKIRIEKCWAVVTGATEGIGKAFCQELVKHNVNICIIARNVEKARNLITELQQINSKVEFKIIEADFKNSMQNNFYQQIYCQLKDLDIGILVNNVGILHVGDFQDIGILECKEQIIINCVSTAMMTKYLLPILQKRKNSIVINLSSQAGIFPSPFYQLYAATKGFVDQFSRSLCSEYHNKVLFTALRPGYVQTRMTKNQKDLLTVVPSSCVKAALARIGVDATGGHWIHRIQQYFMGFAKDTMLNNLLSPAVARKLAYSKH